MQQQEQPLRVACPGMTAIAVVAVTDTDVNTCAATQALLLPARVCWDPTLACWVECISSESAPDHLPRGLSSSSRPSYQALLLNCLLVSCMRGTSQPGELACVFGGGSGGGCLSWHMRRAFHDPSPFSCISLSWSLPLCVVASYSWTTTCACIPACLHGWQRPFSAAGTACLWFKPRPCSCVLSNHSHVPPVLSAAGCAPAHVV